MTQQQITVVSFDQWIKDLPNGYVLIQDLPADDRLATAIIMSAGQHLADLDQKLQWSWGDLINIIEGSRRQTVQSLKGIVAGMIPASRQITENTLRTWSDCANRWSIDRRHYHPVTWSHHYRLCPYSDAIQDEIIEWLLDNQHSRVPSVTSMLAEVQRRYPPKTGSAPQPYTSYPPAGVTDTEIAEMDRDAMAAELFETRQQLAEKDQELATYKSGWEASVDLLNQVVAGEVELPPLHRQTWRPIIRDGQVFIRDESGETLASTDSRVAAYLRYWAEINRR